MKNQEINDKTGYPQVLLQLPEAEMPLKGARAWIMQSNSYQLVFFEFGAHMNLPDHNHTYPQWGMVIDGEMELRIDGKRRIYKNGGEYLVPVGALHGPRFLKRTRVMDFFSEKNRYNPKITLHV